MNLFTKKIILIIALGVILTSSTYPLLVFLAPVFNELVIIIIFGSFVALVCGFIWTFVDQSTMDYKMLKKKCLSADH